MSRRLLKPTKFGSDFYGRKFPHNAKDTLRKIDDLFFAWKYNSIKWDPEALVQRINLFLYNLSNAKDLKTTKLRPLEKLRLGSILLEYFSKPLEENDRLGLFATIFYATNFQIGDVPLEILGIVASLAVTFRNSPVLDTLALWMLATGLEHPSVIYIGMHLSNDFVKNEYPIVYNGLPLQAQRFTAVLLVAIGKAYKDASPPKPLIERVTSWIESTPSVCFIPPQSSVFDLFRWCICIPKFRENREEKFKLQYALINAVDKEGKGTQLPAFNEIMKLTEELKAQLEPETSSQPNEKVEAVVNALMQLLQMFASAECLDVKEIRSVFESLEESSLPRTLLFNLLKSYHLTELFYKYRQPRESTL